MREDTDTSKVPCADKYKKDLVFPSPFNTKNITANREARTSHL